MPDPTRPTPGRRPNQGALVVILAALMLVNLTTFGVLVSRGWFSAADFAAEEVPELTQIESHPFAVPNSNGPDRAERARARDAAVDDVLASLMQPTEEQAVSEPGVMPTPVVEDTPTHESGDAPSVLPQVAESTPELTPVTDPEPANEPVRFFGLPIFE